MAQQIIERTRQRVPGAGVTRTTANTGILVKISGKGSPPSGREVKYPVAVVPTSAATDKIDGVQLDYDNPASTTIGQCGTFKVKRKSGITVADTDLGKGLKPSTTAGEADTPADDGIGSLVDYDDDYLYYELNLP